MTKKDQSKIIHPHTGKSYGMGDTFPIMTGIETRNIGSRHFYQQDSSGVWLEQEPEGIGDLVIGIHPYDPAKTFSHNTHDPEKRERQIIGIGLPLLAFMRSGYLFSQMGPIWVFNSKEERTSLNTAINVLENLGSLEYNVNSILPDPKYDRSYVNEIPSLADRIKQRLAFKRREKEIESLWVGNIYWGWGKKLRFHKEHLLTFGGEYQEFFKFGSGYVRSLLSCNPANSAEEIEKFVSLLNKLCPDLAEKKFPAYSSEKAFREIISRQGKEIGWDFVKS
ncbi:MAG: hypothetical protein KAT43_02850 [Nanoarchaeota archaeon]|nr:hypothetical protein [Nanoarchaeota archaeon]